MILLLLTVPLSAKKEVCRGAVICTACKDCSACKYCKAENKNCGICQVGKPARKSVIKDSLSTDKKKKKN